ncbi:cytosine permease [Pseudomonas typographi]|uniref:cytosine permease n=1 Tax=Pseudomonas typographi TaxID=2715964 RepID=UPI001686A402|nr:cytosine permease [Pseudomonas typographi]MBD1588846.1 hypothetical protein [Pseudomonas typographi]
MNQTSSSHAEQEALSGRIPVLSGERVYTTYGSFLWTCCAFSAATWSFLIGSYLPFVGDWRLGVMGYVVGLIIGMALVTLASGVPSYKYGTDTIDASKSSYGYRGILIPLVSLLITLIGWGYVVEALTARGASNIVATISGTSITGAGQEHLVIGVAMALLCVVWVTTCKGPKLFERLNAYIGPFHMIVTVIMLGILINKYGVHTLWSSQLPADQMLTKSPIQGMALAVEFGVGAAMTWWPVIGGLTRLVKHKKHIIGPPVIGVGILGSAVVSTVAALAAISAGTYDPTVWMIAVGGSIFGSIVMTVVLAANLATMVVLIYLAAVSVQQIKVFARMRWELLIGLLLLPGLYFAFKTEWLLSVVMTWLSYNGVMFVGISAITTVDYFFLRKQRLDAASMFAKENSQYAYWGGVNWVAVVITIASVFGYLKLYDPATVVMAPAFNYFGASIPTFFLSGLAYYLAARLILIPMGKGGYLQHAQSIPTLGKSTASGTLPVSL